jgi:RNA polymerase sigma-70 factor, ECF subfamily
MALTKERFLQLFVQEYGKLRAYTWQFVHDDYMVEEVLQDLALTVVNKLSEIRDEHHFLAWARITCRNLSMNAIRKRNRQPVMMSNQTLDLLEACWQRYDNASTSGLLAALRKCISLLGPQAKRLIELRYAEGLRFVQIAEQLEQNKNTVYAALARVHRALGKCIEKAQFEEETANG